LSITFSYQIHLKTKSGPLHFLNVEHFGLLSLTIENTVLGIAHLSVASCLDLDQTFKVYRFLTNNHITIH